ncbi:URC4/urg3 family protein [Chelatococcus sp. SYSU_G07232]|uniref:URC4/urg3 family protein n=1 Tax=Chelatococcus albus TaxID=3047466 RepID=A0ABT7AE78_9HYPH|nr:URC4/urg3 family protein [Chelatococcus sp. SYSU_G07232]MDJ1157658.1 URC4/urg3 family protein [Chelatococcus sp. SYSU_G07232]
MHEPAPDAPTLADAARGLLSARAVRERARAMLALAREDGLLACTVDLDRLPATADYVLDTMRRNYPALDIPFHARWRHFSVGGFDRWGTLTRNRRWTSAIERGRAAFDIAIVSVLLDAGAGPGWSYAERETGERYARSEGLAVASLRMAEAGLFSSDPRHPLRADAGALQAVTPELLARGFAAGPDNPLVGLPGRASLLNRLGAVVAANPDVFAWVDDPRPGGLFDYLLAQAEGGTLPAEAILSAILTHLGPIWPARLSLGGVDLGDTWEHPLAPGTDGTAGLVPFHKLSQWLAYSLIEPLQEAGIAVTHIDGLTGLPEYRNGGLLLDMGVIRLKDAADGGRTHSVGSPLVVEWRALTVALLDEIAALVRQRLGRTAEELPLAKVLEGGTWSAGRRMARERRGNGSPPLSIVSDGTVF